MKKINNVSDDVLRAMTYPDYIPFWHGHAAGRFLVGLKFGLSIPFLILSGIFILLFVATPCYYFGYLKENGQLPDLISRPAFVSTYTLGVLLVYIATYNTAFSGSSTAWLTALGLIIAILAMPISLKRPGNSKDSIIKRAWVRGKDKIAYEGIRRLRDKPRIESQWQKATIVLPQIAEKNKTYAFKLAAAIKNRNHSTSVKLINYIDNAKINAIRSTLTYLKNSITPRFLFIFHHIYKGNYSPYGNLKRIQCVCKIFGNHHLNYNKKDSALRAAIQCKDSRQRLYCLDALIQSEIDITIDSVLRSLQKQNHLNDEAFHFFKNKYGVNYLTSATL